MTDHATHGSHEHVHGPECGHSAVDHAGHTDFLHEGHLHQPHGDHVDEHVVESDATNPAHCTPEHDCDAHHPEHVHDETCEHEAVPHGDHVDYLADGHLHRPHADHCDDHGRLTRV